MEKINKSDKIVEEPQKPIDPPEAPKPTTSPIQKRLLKQPSEKVDIRGKARIVSVTTQKPQEDVIKIAEIRNKPAKPAIERKVTPPRQMTPPKVVTVTPRVTVSTTPRVTVAPRSPPGAVSRRMSAPMTSTIRKPTMTAEKKREVGIFLNF